MQIRFRIPEIFLGALLAAAVFAMGMTFESSIQPPHNNSTATAQSDAKDKSGDNGKKTQSLLVPTDSVGLYTLVLAAFTGLLFGVSAFQGVMLLRAEKTARIAANAADLSAKAAVGQKLPIIRCKTPHMWPSKDQFYAGTFGGTGDPTEDNFIKIIELDFMNYGETIAYPKEYGLGWLFTEREPTEREILPAEPFYSDIHSLSHELVIADAFTTPRNVTFCLITDDKMKASLNSGAGALRFCAYLRYDDFIGTEHEARFCWRWNVESRDHRHRRGLSTDNSVPEAYRRKT
jgi:hypothetical protein